MGIIRVNMQRCLPKFLYYYLNYSMKFREEIKLLTQGANINNISSTINSIEIPLPPIDVQERTITELDGYQQVVNGAKSVLSNYCPKLSCSTATYKTLDEVATFRPSKDEIKALPGDTDVSFVPMASLNTFDASFEAVETRKLTDVSSGFTYFRNNDILLAKITPCFENGKAGIAHNLKNGIGFGSTEYIVIRADESVVYPEWIFYYINTREFIDGGKPFMTGTAGQQRIDINYVKQYQIPVPSLEEQKMLLDEIHREQALIKPSKQIIDVFTAKIDTRIKEIWGE